MITLALMCLMSAPPEARGLEIAEAAAAADRGWKTERVTVTLEVRVGGAVESRRVFEVLQSEGSVQSDGREERSLVRLLKPSRHKGMKVLTITAVAGDETVWIRLPRHARTLHMVGRKRTGRFLGSDLTYEDLGSRRHDRYHHRYLRDESVGGVACHVVETRPKDDDSGYSKILLWREVASYRLMKVAWFDPSGKGVKTGTFHDFETIGGFQRPKRYVIENALTGRQTHLSFAERTLGEALAPGALTRGSLER